MRLQSNSGPFQILAAKHRKGSITCVTCKLKRCVGQCRFEAVASPRPPKAA